MTTRHPYFSEEMVTAVRLANSDPDRTVHVEVTGRGDFWLSPRDLREFQGLAARSWFQRPVPIPDAELVDGWIDAMLAREVAIRGGAR